LPEIAKWEDDSESLILCVNGLLARIANFADVVSGLPTRGLNTNSNGASGPSGLVPSGVSSISNRVPNPPPPMNLRSVSDSIAIDWVVCESRSMRR